MKFARVPTNGVIRGLNSSVLIYDDFQELTMYQQYKRTGNAEATPWVEGFDMNGVSVNQVDKDAGSPKDGDMIARNPKNHNDKWLIAKKYFEDNFECV